MAATLRLRRLADEDLDAVRDLGRRCSPRTLRDRFHGQVSDIPVTYLRDCLPSSGSGQHAVVAELTGDDGARHPTLVGLASLGRVPGTSGVCEAAALVEDRWQRRGIGSAMLGRLLATARADGVQLVRLELCRAQPALLAYLTTHLPTCSARRSGCDVTLDVALPALATTCDRSRPVDLSSTLPPTLPPHPGPEPGRPRRR